MFGCLVVVVGGLVFHYFFFWFVLFAEICCLGLFWVAFWLCWLWQADALFVVLVSVWRLCAINCADLLKNPAKFANLP